MLPSMTTPIRKKNGNLEARQSVLQAKYAQLLQKQMTRMRSWHSIAALILVTQNCNLEIGKIS